MVFLVSYISTPESDLQVMYQLKVQSYDDRIYIRVFFLLREDPRHRNFPLLPRLAPA